MDRHILIAEIRKRPALWDLSNPKPSARIPDLWREVAHAMGVDDVEECKRKWRSLRDAYRAEVKRIESRIENDMLSGVYNTKNDYSSKWVFFEPMSFINNARRSRVIREYENSNSNDNNINTNYNDDAMYDNTPFTNISNIKLEPQDNMNKDILLLEDTDQTVNNLLKESNHLSTLPALKRRPPTKSINNISESSNNESPQYLPIPRDINRLPATISVNIVSHNQEQSDQSTTSKSPNSGKCYQHTDDQMNFLENIEREEQALITSTRRDITHSNNIDHIGDSDYNFLVSFLPKMKKMSQLQNLQFRAKMSQIILNVYNN